MRIKRKNLSDEIPTGSMADIAFLLIIYFMVTTTFAATRGLDFALPKDDDRPPIIEKEESVLIEINPGGALVVDGKPKQLDEILDYLKPKLERNPLKPVIIKPDPSANYGDMAMVFDRLRLSGLTKEEAPDLADADLKFADYPKVKNISIPTQREIEAFWY